MNVVVSDTQDDLFQKQIEVLKRHLMSDPRSLRGVFVADGTQADFASGVTGTPTVLIDGKPFTGDLLTADALRSAIETAAND